jgi:hypothetical protein
MSPFAKSSRCRVASSGRPSRPSSGDGVDRCGLVDRLSWAQWPKPEHGVPRILNANTSFVGITRWPITYDAL